MFQNTRLATSLPNFVSWSKSAVYVVVEAADFVSSCRVYLHLTAYCSLIVSFGFIATNYKTLIDWKSMRRSYYVKKFIFNGNQTGNIFVMGTIYHKSNITLKCVNIVNILLLNYCYELKIITLRSLINIIHFF